MKHTFAQHRLIIKGCSLKLLQKPDCTLERGAVVEC